MALSQKLEIRQSHALVMTPQLMQAIKLLQLSNLDLVAYVENELERNPLLERSSAGDGEAERRTSNGEAGPTGEATSSDWTDGGLPAGAVTPSERARAELDEGPAADDADGAAPRASADTPLGYSE